MRPFLYTDGTGIVDLGALPGGTGGTAQGINALGQAVGSGDTAAGLIHALFFSNGTVTDLNSLISASSGWVLETAVDINDSGLIVGTGRLNGRLAPFQLTPVPEPSTLTLAAVGAGAFYLRLRRRRLP
jgi:probable HAF family extracellular repeat protein